MTKWGRSGLRLRLQILVLLAVLPAVGLILYTASDQRRVASREVQQNALRLAKVAAADHELLVDGARHFLTASAQLPSIRGRDDRACNELLATSFVRCRHSLKPQGASRRGIWVLAPARRTDGAKSVSSPAPSTRWPGLWRCVTQNSSAPSANFDGSTGPSAFSARATTR